MERKMYNIAIMSIDESEYSIPAELNLSGIHVKSEKHLLGELEKFHGVIIYQYEEEYNNNVFDRILSIRRCLAIPIWIRNQGGNKLNRELNIKLGSIGNLDRNVSDEEMFNQVFNTLDIIYAANKKNGSGDVGVSVESDLILNELNCSIQIGELPEIRLTILEYKLVSILNTNIKGAITYADLYQKVWPTELDKGWTEKKYRLANIVFHVRNKLKAQGVNPEIIQTVRSVGYLMNPDIWRVEDFYVSS